MPREPKPIYHCYVCKFPITHMHHIVPRANGGTDDPSNLVPLCPNHHAAMHLLISEFRWDPVEAAMARESGLPPRKQTRRHRYLVRFAFQDEALLRLFREVFMPRWDTSRVRYRRPNPAIDSLFYAAVNQMFGDILARRAERADGSRDEEGETR